MTRTEAAETIALHVRVAARRSGRRDWLTMAEEIVSEYRGGHNGGFLQDVAKRANPRTVARLAAKQYAADNR